jgi:hypothetical protein
MRKWQLRGQGPSQLGAELAAASETLTSHPYAGQRWRNGYRLQLGRTGFVIFYMIDEKHSIVVIRALIHGRARGAR